MAEAEASERDAKRQKTDPQGLSMDADLEVVVEGETFRVHSLILMMASPVFKQMLSHNMREASERRIDLKDKKKDEFTVFLEVMQPFCITTFVFTVEKALFLARWSDEYQVQPLKEQCEVYLMKQAPITIAALAHAVECGLAKRTAQCMERIAGGVFFPSGVEAFLPELKTSGPVLPAPVMELLWPWLCKAANLGDTPGMPDIHHIRSSWAFIFGAMSKEKCIKEEKMKLATLKRKVSTLKTEMDRWPSYITRLSDKDTLRDCISNSFSKIQADLA